MSDERPDVGIEDGVALSREVFAEGGDFQLLCCGSSSMKPWMSAAEIIYEFTGEPGSVVRNTITFRTSADETIDVNLLNGGFEVRRPGGEVATGRKGVELLMRWRAFSFEQALEWIVQKHSVEAAEAMAHDFVTMRLRGIAGRTSQGA